MPFLRSNCFAICWNSSLRSFCRSDSTVSSCSRMPAEPSASWIADAGAVPFSQMCFLTRTRYLHGHLAQRLLFLPSSWKHLQLLACMKCFEKGITRSLVNCRLNLLYSVKADRVRPPCSALRLSLGLAPLPQPSRLQVVASWLFTRRDVNTFYSYSLSSSSDCFVKTLGAASWLLEPPSR